MLPLFEPSLPPGFHYRADFISREEEAALIESISEIEFSEFEMRGVVARRRVAFFGRSYDAVPGPEKPIPEFLSGIRDRLAEWAGVAPAAFAMALINEYREAAPIGWHRDAPQYDIVAGLSLLAKCRMKLRPYVVPRLRAANTGGATARQAPRKTTHEIELQPRSAYLITGEARQAYEHSIPPVESLRYSITFRTLR
ncbi:MAG TPA: alpha-ketoglutarate-dependent dioxygenase AlkB [Vicinamibacterales bacterium]|nr:alpha-ketoglutarate-dependent dioxygenase AlkB [Vicinamibacterales bacterium]